MLWYTVCRDHLALLVVARDPSGVQPDDYFFTADLDGLAATVASQCAGRLFIEDTFKSTKQFLKVAMPLDLWSAVLPKLLKQVDRAT